MPETQEKQILKNPLPEITKVDTSEAMRSYQDLLVTPLKIQDFQTIRENNPESRDVVDALILKQLKERLEQLKRMTARSLNRTQQEMLARNVDEMERIVAAMEDGKNIARMNPRYIGLINPKAPGYEKMALDAISGEKAVFTSIDSKFQKNPDFVNRALKANPLVIDYIENLDKLDKWTLKSVYEYFFKNQNLLATLDKNKEFILGFIAQYKELSVAGKWKYEPLSIQNLPPDIDNALKNELSPVMQVLFHRHKSINTLGGIEKAYLSILEENPSDIEHLESARKNPNFVLELLRACKARMANDGSNIPPSYRQVNLTKNGKEPYNFAYILRYTDDSVKQDQKFIYAALKEGLIDERDLFEILSQGGNYEFIRTHQKDFPAAAKLLEKLSGSIDELVKKSPSSWTDEELKNIKSNPWLLKNISSNTEKTHKNNLRELTLRIVSLRGSAIAFAPESLKKDREIAMAAVKQNGIAIRFLDSSLKKDREITFEAIKNTGYAFKFIDSHWKKDDKFLLECAKIEKSSLSGSSEYVIGDKDEISERNEKIGSFGAKYICEALPKLDAKGTIVPEILRTLATVHGNNFGEIIFKDTQNFEFVRFIYDNFNDIKNDKTFLKLVLSYRLQKNDTMKGFFDKILGADLKNLAESTQLLKSAEQKNASEQNTSIEHRRTVFCEFLKNKKDASRSIEKTLKLAQNKERFADMYQYIDAVASGKSSQQEMFDKLKTLFSEEYTTDDISAFIKNLIEFETVRIEFEKKKNDTAFSTLPVTWENIPNTFKEKYLLEDGKFDIKKATTEFKLHVSHLSLEDQKQPDRWVGSFFESKGFSGLKFDPPFKEKLEESLDDTKKQIVYSALKTQCDALGRAIKEDKPAPTFEKIIDTHPDIIKKVVQNWDQHIRSDSVELFARSEKIVYEREEKEQKEIKKITPETLEKKETIPVGKSISPEEITKYYTMIPSGKVVPMEWDMTFEMRNDGVGAIRSRSGFEITTKSQNELTWAIHSMEFLKSVWLDFLSKEEWEAFIEWVSGKLREHNLPAINLAQWPSVENKKILLGFFECIINNGHLPKTTLDSLENKYSRAVNLHRPIRDVMKNKIIWLDETKADSLAEPIHHALDQMNPDAVDLIYHMPKAS